MILIADPTKEFSECPWCHTPGRLIVRASSTDLGGQPYAVSVGCANNKCEVKPHSMAVVITEESTDALQEAMNKCISRWEDRNATL